MDFLRQLFGSGDFMPHGYCYMWNPGLLPKINGPEAYARMIAERPDVSVIFATG